MQLHELALLEQHEEAGLGLVAAHQTRGTLPKTTEILVLPGN